MRRPLGTDIEALRADFESVRGKPFEHYWCPILHVDEPAPLCKGHVVPKSMGGTSKVLQRQDVDNGFGEFFEAEAGDAIRHGVGRDDLLARILSGNPDDVKAIRRRFKIETMLDPDGESIKVDARRVDGEVQFFVRTEDLGGAAGDVMGLFGVGLDARSSILVTALATPVASGLNGCRQGWSGAGFQVGRDCCSAFARSTRGRTLFSSSTGAASSPCASSRKGTLRLWADRQTRP